MRKVVIDAGAKEEDAKPASIEEEMKGDVMMRSSQRTKQVIQQCKKK